MQRKFLEDLGLEKDVIDKIMTENGNDINNAKKKLEAERDNYKEQLDTAQTALKDFEGVDVNELNDKIKKLTTDLSAKDSEYQAKIADMEFSSILDNAISGSKAKNAKAVKATLVRPLPSGALGERDVYGAQQHAPLMNFEFVL